MKCPVNTTVNVNVVYVICHDVLQLICEDYFIIFVRIRHFDRVIILIFICNVHLL